MKKLILALTLLMCLCLLTACQSGTQQRYDVKSSNGGTTAQTQQSTAAQTPAEEDNYDPLAEEDDYWTAVTQVPPRATATPAPTIRSEYAGATPVVIDPIDKPTPTPVPPLDFAYQVYDATKLGISFEGPVGWLKDDSASDTFIIQNPATGVDYYATLTIRAEKVNSNYSTSQLEQVVKNMLDAIGSGSFAMDGGMASFDEYDPSSTASRPLMGQKGIYGNYTGTLSTGAKIAGRVQAACVDKVLYTIHITYPYAYRDTYIDKVFHHLRDTIKVTR